MTRPVLPEFDEILERGKSAINPLPEELPLERARHVMEKALLRWGGDGPTMREVIRRTVPGPYRPVPIVIYDPYGSDDHRPALVYVHGGGFVLGSVKSHDSLVRHLASAAGAVVVSVDYQLAPEFRFPVAPRECAAVVRWTQENRLRLGARIPAVGIAGDSAGAALVATVSMMLRDDGHPLPDSQFLFYPPLDSSCDTESWDELGEGMFLWRSTMRWFWDCYLPKSASGRRGLEAQPLRAGTLRDLPPTLVVTPGLDPLRDEGRMFHERLQQDGVVSARVTRVGAIHGYLGMPTVSAAARADLGFFGALIGRCLREDARAVLGSMPGQEPP